MSIAYTPSLKEEENSGTRLMKKEKKRDCCEESIEIIKVSRGREKPLTGEKYQH